MKNKTTTELFVASVVGGLLTIPVLGLIPVISVTLSLLLLMSIAHLGDKLK